MLAAFVAATAYVATTSSPYTQNVLILTAIFVILALSLDLAAGMTGQYSLGHAALFAVGAYITAILAEQHGTNAFILLPLSILGTAFVGALIGLLSLRLSGLYFAITTFIFSLLLVVIVNRLDITGGYAGIIGPNFPEFPSWLSELGSPLVWCCAACVVITVLVARNLRSSPLYPALLATRDAEAMAAGAGIRVARARIAIFTLSAALAGMAGWLFAFLGVVSPTEFEWTVSVNILVMVILGGINSTPGPILGAMVINLFSSYVNISPLWQQVLFGALFVLTIAVMPDGVMGLLRLGVGRLGRRHESTEAEEPPESRPAKKPNSTMGERTRSGPPGAGPVIECRGVSYQYTKGTRVLEDVDVSVTAGTIHGLIGPNGSGKSTLLNLISGHLRPQAGTILIGGKSVEARPASERARLGMRRTFQSASLVEELSSVRNVAVGQYLHTPRLAARAPVWGMSLGTVRDSRKITTTSRDALRTLGVRPRWDSARVSDVPHGIQQLLQLAVAEVGRPNMLLLDEPVAGLSADEVARTAEILMEMRAAGVTIVIVEHHTRFIFEICDQVTVLNAGKLVLSAAAADVRGDTVVRDVYLGA
jgi:branched-chain amino acid transport system permease protein